MSAKKKTRLVVRVQRESTDGQVYSQVEDREVTDGQGRHPRLVIDRAHRGRHYLHQGAVIDRAKTLAQVIGAEFEVDLRWKCALSKNVRCGCPKCVEAGR